MDLDSERRQHAPQRVLQGQGGGGCLFPPSIRSLPQDLWTYLEIQRTQEGVDVFAIPHNSNVSDGWMFSERKFIGTPRDRKFASRNIGAPMDARYARASERERAAVRDSSDQGQLRGPSVAVAQRRVRELRTVPEPDQPRHTPSQIKGGFYRQGLVEGMKLETELGYNPYKMGLVAGADVHSGYQGNEEWDWKGAHGTLDDTPKKRLNPVPNATGENGFTVSSAGTTAVWATENTRDGIWNGMRSKETYGTTGTLIRLRFFGGWGYPDDLLEDAKFVEKAYKGGVPMGQDLHKKPGSAKAPTFAVWALKDPESGNLDRIQIVKVWTNPRTGFPAEKIYDVAWSDNRKLDAKTGKLAPGGQHG